MKKAAPSPEELAAFHAAVQGSVPLRAPDRVMFAPPKPTPRPRQREQDEAAAIIESLYAPLDVDGRVIALVKPQFEAGRAAIGKGGVVRDPSVHLSVLERTAEFLSTNTSLTLNGCTFSPLRGPSGNIEFLFDILRVPHLSTEPTDFNSIVEEAHRTLSPAGDREAQNS